MQKFQIEIKYAMLFTVLMLVWSIGEKELGYHDAKIGSYSLVSMLSSIVGLAVYFFAIREKKRAVFQGVMTWSQGFVSGVFLSFFIALLSPLGQYVVFYQISPELFPNLIDYVVKHNRMEREQAELYFSFRSYVIQSAFTSLSAGVIAAALVALVLRSAKTQKA